jgi:hypothetical protein
MPPEDELLLEDELDDELEELLPVDELPELDEEPPPAGISRIPAPAQPVTMLLTSSTSSRPYA